MTGNHASLDSLILPAKKLGTINLSFNFLTKQITDKSKYTYHVIQKEQQKIIGGETYVINKNAKTLFQANAGGDKEVLKNNSVTLNAQQISNLMVYNWYDLEGNLIYVGKDLTVTADITKKYKLEVIDIDGYKDYDEIEVKVHPFKLNSILPNPASNQITVSYNTNGVSSTYLMIVNIDTAVSYNYLLESASNEKVIDVSNFNTGLYKLILVCDGEIADQSTLIKN